MGADTPAHTSSYTCTLRPYTTQTAHMPTKYIHMYTYTGTSQTPLNVYTEVNSTRFTTAVVEVGGWHL